MKNTIHVEYIEIGENGIENTIFMIVNRYSDVPKGVRIVSVKVVN